MNFIHLSDLHLGKRMHNYDIMEEQKDALNQVLQYACSHDIDAVIIAGDVYDTSQPPVEAVRLLDWFLTSLADAKKEVIIIAGNHDSADRLAFGKHLMEKSGIQIAGCWEGVDRMVRLQDALGEVVLHLVPYLRPRNMRQYDHTIQNQDDAFGYVRSRMDLTEDARHVLVAHQFFSGSFADREQIIMGQEMVDARWLEGFDYCALGHLHTAQKAGAETSRYAGTLLKFNASEAGRQKTFTVVRMEPDVQTEQVPIVPLRDVIKIQGTLTEVTSPAFVRQVPPDSYIAAELEDEKEIAGAMDQLRDKYPRILSLEWKKSQSRAAESARQAATMELDGMHLIENFFEIRTGKPLSEMQQQIMSELWKEVQDETD